MPGYRRMIAALAATTVAVVLGLQFKSVFNAHWGSSHLTMPL